MHCFWEPLPDVQPPEPTLSSPLANPKNVPPAAPQHKSAELEDPPYPHLQTQSVSNAAQYIKAPRQLPTSSPTSIGPHQDQNLVATYVMPRSCRNADLRSYHKVGHDAALRLRWF